ncbi:hypothetical protein GCM10009816_12050 [Microbacterium aquimaris]
MALSRPGTFVPFSRVLLHRCSDVNPNTGVSGRHSHARECIPERGGVGVAFCCPRPRTLREASEDACRAAYALPWQ